jgi:co-chaperonin GroES (HSP10)
MPQTREQIRSTSLQRETYVSPHYDDGGWHGSSFGSEKFDADWQPMFDRILVRLLPDAQPVVTSALLKGTHKLTGAVVLVGARKTECRRGIVLAVGPGKRIPEFGNRRYPMDSKPGDEVIIGRWDDWQAFGEHIVLCQEADIRVVVQRAA